ncbi:hypothetical protein [Clostridium tertium]|uniref:hypothetical protein n=1 Tax=Clostridium tertium TaxID=1559 RepID=UPI001AE518DF|nr:hypothetical protein [Clostridium tertium]MBP1869014.1 hypothetical protein [Clostridium tertium]
MAVEKITEKSIVNIVRVEVETEETTPKIYRFDTASEATYAAVVSEGQETILRAKNKILATNKTEDIQYGSDVNLTQVVMVPEVLAIVDGGTLTKTLDKVTGYRPPAMGEVVNRTGFKLRIFTEEKDGDGETLGYQCFEYPGCKGKPVSFNFKDGEFMAPAYTISSRVKKGTAPYNLDFLDELPV